MFGSARADEDPLHLGAGAISAPADDDDDFIFEEFIQKRLEG